MPELALCLPKCVLKVQKLYLWLGKEKNKGRIREDEKEKEPLHLDLVRWVRFETVEMAARA